MKNKFLSKMMMVALIFCSMFLISACSLQKDVNIETIEINEESIPEFIRVGEFDDAKIELVVNYDDGSKEEVFVTSSMLSSESQECLQTPGIYEIEILFKGEKTTLNITIVQASTYLVEFYNGKQQLINRQFVTVGEDAIAPAESVYAMFGYDFIGWDRLFTDVTEDIKVYGVYSKLTTEDMNTYVHEKMVNALTYMYSNDYVFTIGGADVELTYHANDGDPISQGVTYEEGELAGVMNCSTNNYTEYWYNSEDGSWAVESEDINHLDTHEKKAVNVMFGGMFSQIFFKEGVEYSYNYTLTENRNIYIVEAIVKEDDSSTNYEKLILTFDDEKMLSCVSQSQYDDVVDELEYLIDYKTEEFITIEDQNLFLMLYNEARTNVLAQTTLRYEEIEAGENGYCFYRNFVDDKAYIYSTHTNDQSREDWIQNENGLWFEYSRYTDSDSMSKEDISSEIINDNLIETYVGIASLINYEELINEFNITFSTYFSGNTIVLTANVTVENEVVKMKYYIENNLVRKVEDFSQDLTWNFIYDAEYIEMPELPTVSE